MRHFNGIGLLKEGSKIDRFLDKKMSSSLFSYQQIFSMFVPLLLDQLFVNLISMLTMSMVSSSSNESAAAVGLVSPIASLMLSIFNSIAAGGTIIVAQYCGKGDAEETRHAAGQVMLATVVIATISSILLMIFAFPLVNLLFGSAEDVLKQKAAQYMIGVAASTIPFAFYASAFGSLRGVGDTKTCLRLTVVINVLHLLGSLLFINVLKMDIIGTAVSLIIARIIGGLYAIYLFTSKNGRLGVNFRDIIKVDWKKQVSIIKMGIPFALEQLFFNGGSLIVQSYMVPLGTAAITANSIANSAVSVLYSPTQAVGTLATTIVGQSIGAKDTIQAKKYGKSMHTFGLIVSLLTAVIVIPVLPFILSIYHPSPEVYPIIYNLILIAAAAMIFFFSMSYVTPSVLRSAGDANFASFVSLIIMWIARVGCGYIFAIPLGYGVYGVWISMGIEWAMRSIIFAFRFKGSKWLKKKVI